MGTDGKRLALVAGGMLVALVAAFWIWWPLGIACGLALGVTATVMIVKGMQAADVEPHDGSVELLFEDA